MKIKKISALVLSLMMVFAMSITAFAATEDDIKSKLEAAGIPDAYMTQVDSFLANNDLDEAQIDAVIEQIDLAVATKGDAKEVPVKLPYPPPARGAVMSTPGADRSGFTWLVRRV